MKATKNPKKTKDRGTPKGKVLRSNRSAPAPIRTAAPKKDMRPEDAVVVWEVCHLLLIQAKVLTLPTERRQHFLGFLELAACLAKGVDLVGHEDAVVSEATRLRPDAAALLVDRRQAGEVPQFTAPQRFVASRWPELMVRIDAGLRARRERRAAMNRIQPAPASDSEQPPSAPFVVDAETPEVTDTIGATPPDVASSPPMERMQQVHATETRTRFPQGRRETRDPRTLDEHPLSRRLFPNGLGSDDEHREMAASVELLQRSPTYITGTKCEGTPPDVVLDGRRVRRAAAAALLISPGSRSIAPCCSSDMASPSASCSTSWGRHDLGQRIRVRAVTRRLQRVGEDGGP